MAHNEKARRAHKLHKDFLALQKEDRIVGGDLLVPRNSPISRPHHLGSPQWGGELQHVVGNHRRGPLSRDF
jgi:hypothetical protein